MTAYRIDIASPPDREKLVAQIIFGDTQWAELSHEDGTLQMEFYSRPDGEPWRIDYQEVIAALDQAKRRLIGP